MDDLTHLAEEIVTGHENLAQILSLDTEDISNSIHDFPLREKGTGTKKWKQLIKEMVTTPEELAKKTTVNIDEIRKVHKEFPLRINPYYLSLIREKDDPIWKQAIPDTKELEYSGVKDPLAEDEHNPVSQIFHKYPDRVLFYVSAVCSMYCRFCTRKRRVSDTTSVSEEGIEQGLQYIRDHSEVRDVIVSGGDPLMLPDSKLEYILKNLKEIKHVEIIRIGTRIPVVLPQRITEELCAMLKKYHPLYINTHFNHPNEITKESKQACEMLANAGIPLGNQSVLLKGVNDDPEVMKTLVQKLLSIRVRPYYIYQADLVSGTDHFRTSVQRGLEIMEALRGHTSGLAVPHFVIDTPGGGGKIAIIPNPVLRHDEKEIILKNYKGNTYRYPSTQCRQEAWVRCPQTNTI